MPALRLRSDPMLSQALTERMTVVGRAGGCDLVLLDEAVSARHAAFWVADGAVWVRDLGSRNGVRLGGEVVTGDTRVPAGVDVVLGETALVVTGEPPARAMALVVEDSATGVATPFVDERLRLGGAGAALLRVEGAPDVVLVRIAAEEVLIGRDDDMVPLALDEPFTVGDRTFVLRRIPVERPPTRELGGGSPGYRVEATLEGGPGPRARIVDLATQATVDVAAENRATLFWLLGQKWRTDEPGEARGWMAEQDLLTGVWGRAAGATPNNLRVLLCRIRRDLREAGFDPWFLEHRAGHLRLRVREVALS